MIEEQKPQSIDWNDFNILMNSYKNMIEVNTVVFEQLKKIIEIQQNILQKNDQTAEKQKLTLDAMNQLLTTLNNMTQAYKDLNNKLDEHSETMADESKSFSNKFQNYELNLVRSDSRVVNKIHIAWGLMGTIVIGLVSLVASVLARNADVEQLIKMVNVLLKNAGIAMQ